MRWQTEQLVETVAYHSVSRLFPILLFLLLLLQWCKVTSNANNIEMIYNQKQHHNLFTEKQRKFQAQGFSICYESLAVKSHGT